MRRPLCCVCIVFVISVYVYLYFCPYSISKQTYADGDRINFIGKVYYKASDKEKYTLYIKGKDEAIMATIKKDKSLVNKSRIPRLGSIVCVEGDIKIFNIPRNPGSFDMRQYYYLQGISYQLNNVDVIKESKSYSKYKEYLYAFREKIENALDVAAQNAYFVKDEDVSVIKAMVLGDKSNLDKEQKTLFQRSGIAHILAISGLHISIIGMGIYSLLKKVKTPTWLASSIAVIIMFNYGQMVGMGNSAYRAIFMFGIKMMSILFKRSYDMLTAWAMAAVAILLEQPLYIFHTGFLLSFGAILGIGGLLDMVKEDTHQFSFAKKTNTAKSIRIKRYLLRIQEILCTNLSIFLVHFPIMLCNYYEFPIYSFGLNLIVIPTVGILMIIGMIFILFASIAMMFTGKNLILIKIMTGVSGYLCHMIIDLYDKLCELSLRLPGSSWIVGRPDNWKIIFFYLVIIILYLFHWYNVELRDSKLRFPFLLKITCILACTSFLTQKTYKELKITFLDVGQGDGIWIENTNGNHYLIDSGSTSNNKLGTYTLIPFLKYTGTSRVDGVFLTHLDTDHMSGIMELLETDSGIEIGRVILAKTITKDDIFEKILQVCKARGIAVSCVQAGDVIIDDELVMRVLHPASGYESESKNAHSIALELEYNGFDALFAGDIEEDGEKILIESLKKEDPDKTIDLYKASHHGSKYSNTEELLATMQPKFTVISCGKNSYGHPHAETLERLEKVGTQVFRTDEKGAITIRVEGNKMRIDTYIR